MRNRAGEESVIFSWTELYSGMDYKEYTRIQNLMDANNIPMKAKVNSLRGKMADNARFGGNPLVTNTAGVGSMNEEYRIIVKKSDYEKAQAILRKGQ